jgi:hypothetical protein
VSTIELQLDDDTLERARRLASARNCSVEQLLGGLLRRLEEGPRQEGDPLLGMLSNEPDLMDKVLESILEARERHPLRQSRG